VVSGQPLARLALAPGCISFLRSWYAPIGAGFGQGTLRTLAGAPDLTHYRLQERVRGPAFALCLPVAAQPAWIDQFARALMPRADGAPANAGLSTNTSWTCLAGADFEWKEIRARSLAEHRAYLQMWIRNMRRDALVPAETWRRPQ